MNSNPNFDGCFLRWAGGKRWLAPRLIAFISKLKYDRYVEPFLGGGSTFFALKPSRSLLSDCNSDLINTYRQVQCRPLEVISRLQRLLVDAQAYYSIRATIPKSKIDRAVRFIYLNRTCFNGLYRTNRQGQFNVPYGGGARTYETLLEKGTIQHAAGTLASSELYCQDFEVTLKLCGLGDIVYCDPAYTVAHGNNGFIRYNETVFSWQCQVRLKAAAVAAAQRGAIVLISNAAHTSLDKLYFPFRPIQLERASMVAARQGRGKFKEYLFLLGGTRTQRELLKRSLVSD